MIAKDGADIPKQHLNLKAAVQDISIGETMDFELVLTKQGSYVIDVNNPGANKSIKMPVRVQQ